LIYENALSYACILNFQLNKKKTLKLRQLIFYLLFLNYFLIKKKAVSFTFKFLNLRKNLIVFNKAPYRFKLSRHQVFFQTFGLQFTFKFTYAFSQRVNQIFIFKCANYLNGLDFCFAHLNFFKVLVKLRLQEWLR
jgi:hypothetical protein